MQSTPTTHCLLPAHVHAPPGVAARVRVQGRVAAEPRPGGAQVSTRMHVYTGYGYLRCVVSMGVRRSCCL